MALETELAQRKCKPCEGGTPALDESTARRFLKTLQNWNLIQNRIEKEYKFTDFVTAMQFVNVVAQIAEVEGHHPDLELGWGRVGVKLTTHAIKGLSENDFIVAAKINQLS